MRGAFIVQLGPETKPAEGRFEGWVQEVDLCRELRFRSSEELLKFLGERFEVAKAVAEKTRTGKNRGPAPLRRKRTCKEKI
jgi:chorismate mutase